MGLLVPAGDSHALARALQRMVADAKLRKHHALRARTAASELSWEAQEHSLVGLYRRILV